MKIKVIVTGVTIAVVWGTTPAWAQQNVTDNPQNASGSVNGQCRLGKLEKANNIIGMEIKDSQDKRLGKVEDLAVDMHNGRIVEVIVATGGVLGVDQRYTAVPPGQFACDPEKKALDLNVDKTRLTEAPSFKMSEWEANIAQPRIVETYQYYGVQPYFTSSEQPATTTPAPAHAGEAQETAKARQCYLGDVQRASKLMGTTVRNLQNDKIGRVENMMVDLPAGRVAEVILATGGFLGLGDELSAVPPQSFQKGSEPETLALDTTKDSLANAPHFKSSEWAANDTPEQVGVVYRSYNVEPYFSTNAMDDTAQNVRDRGNDTLTPLKQGTSDADINTTRQIRKQIIAADGLSINARNVKIITIDGRVTLRGPVNNEDEKRRIGGIAAGVASAANVDNQLQVGGYSPSSSAASK